MDTSPDSSAPLLFTRREALQRAALLLGFALSPSILTGGLQAQTPPAGRSRYLSPRQLDIAGTIIDRILPRTETPGALDVGVLSFADLMYGEYMTLEERERFIGGLELTDAASLASYKMGYGRLSTTLQERVLTAVAEASAGEENSFFNQIKELAIVGYFTSETVIKTVLRYEPVPGPFQGNIPASAVGPATWAPSR